MQEETVRILKSDTTTDKQAKWNYARLYLGMPVIILSFRFKLWAIHHFIFLEKKKIIRYR